MSLTAQFPSSQEGLINRISTAHCSSLTVLCWCCAALVSVPAPIGAASSEAALRPPGRLVDIGGYRLHLWCMGKPGESPTVVFLPGAGDFSFTWGLVQPEVAKFTRACSYDKAFNAWSDPGPLPRTMKQEAYDLHTLLDRAGIKAPYILVGASAGGPLARVFAREYRNEVAGMVLVDSTDADTVLFLNGKPVRLRELSKGRALPPVQTAQTSPPPTGPLTPQEQAQIEDYRKMLGTPHIEEPHDRLPINLQKMDTWARFHFNPLGIRSMNPFEGEEFQQLFEEQQRGEPPLGSIPLIVLVAGDKPGTVEGQEKADADPGRKLQLEKRRQKIAQALLSRNGKYLIVQSGHEIHLYEPAWVIEAIREVVDAARKRARH